MVIFFNKVKTHKTIVSIILSEFYKKFLKVIIMLTLNCKQIVQQVQEEIGKIGRNMKEKKDKVAQER